MHRVHHGCPGEQCAVGLGQSEGAVPTLLSVIVTRQLTWGCVAWVAAGARMWRLVWLHRVAFWLHLVHDSWGCSCP